MPGGLRDRSILIGSRSFFVNPCELAPTPESSLDAGAEDGPKLHGKKATEKKVYLSTTTKAARISILELVRKLVADRAELPVSAIRPESHLLHDIHLNSITVGQLVAEAARELNLPRPISPTNFADATVCEVAKALEEQQAINPGTQRCEVDTLPAGIDSWVRPFRVELVEKALRRNPLVKKKGQWRVLATPNDSLAESLRQRLIDLEAGNGIVVCLPNEPDESIIPQLLEAARLILNDKENPKFVLVQRNWSAAAFARTLHLEAPQVSVCVVTVPRPYVKAVDWVIAEALAADGYSRSSLRRNRRAI